MAHSTAASNNGPSVCAGENLCDLVHGVNCLMEQVRLIFVDRVATVHCPQVRTMQHKIAQIKPTASAPVQPKKQDCASSQIQMPQQFHLQQSSSFRSCEEHSALQATSRAADRAGKSASKEIIIDGNKQTKKDKGRVRVAFGCCLPLEATTTKSSNTGTKMSVTAAAHVSTVPSFGESVSVSDEPTSNVVLKSIARSCTSPSVVRAAEANATAASFGSQTSDSSVAVKARQQTSSAALLDSPQPKQSLKVHLHEEYKWPRLERALNKYHQRARNTDSRHKENYGDTEQVEHSRMHASPNY